MDIEELKSKIQTLENENRLLKDRLKEAGISYADICEEDDPDKKIAFDPDQGARIRKFAVIDREIVWYGSVNLLSKEDAEDNLMRVCSKDIAAELLEITFGAEKEIQRW